MTLLRNVLENLIELDDLISRRRYESEDWDIKASKMINNMYGDLKVVEKTYEDDEDSELIMSYRKVINHLKGDTL